MKNKYEIRNDKVVIFLRRRNDIDLEAIIDADDFEKVNEYPGSWYGYWSKFTKSHYVCGNTQLPCGKRTVIYLHRYLTDCPDGMFVDHFNHDTLDNTRANLRITTVSENSLHRLGKPNSNNTLGIKGVYLQGGKYAVMVRQNRKTVTLGRFDTLDEAKIVSDEYYSKDRNCI